MRHRLEDLGRIAVMLDAVLNGRLFRLPVRARDYLQYFEEKSLEEKQEIVHNMAVDIEVVSDFLVKTLEIARGEDALNECSTKDQQ